jgi:hypothetical protein
VLRSVWQARSWWCRAPGPLITRRERIVNDSGAMGSVPDEVKATEHDRLPPRVLKLDGEAQHEGSGRSVAADVAPDAAA